jgi:hypothetical protein
MYRNYDGAGGRFGDVGVRATSADSEQLSVYAAERGSDGALTVMVVNKSGVERTSSLSLRGRTAGSTQVYRYGVGNLGAIVREADQRILVPPPVAGAPNGILSHTFPADSVTLFVIGAPSTPPPLTVRHRNLDRSPTDARIRPAIELDNPGRVPVDLSRVTIAGTEP